MKPRERVAVLLTLLGGSRRVELAGAAVERVRPDAAADLRRRKVWLTTAKRPFDAAAVDELGDEGGEAQRSTLAA